MEKEVEITEKVVLEIYKEAYINEFEKISPEDEAVVDEMIENYYNNKKNGKIESI
jgi:hypothetical protein